MWALGSGTDYGADPKTNMGGKPASAKSRGMYEFTFWLPKLPDSMAFAFPGIYVLHVFLYDFLHRQPSCMIEARYDLSFRLHEMAIIVPRR